MVYTVVSPFTPANYLSYSNRPETFVMCSRITKSPVLHSPMRMKKKLRDENKAGSNIYLYTVLQIFSLTKYR